MYISPLFIHLFIAAPSRVYGVQWSTSLSFLPHAHPLSQVLDDFRVKERSDGLLIGNGDCGKLNSDGHGWHAVIGWDVLLIIFVSEIVAAGCHC